MNRTSGDFIKLLESNGVQVMGQTGVSGSTLLPTPHSQPPGVIEVHGTTVVALKYNGGVLNVGDRRATAANAVMYDRADKILALDDHTLVAVAGAYGRAIEIVRLLRHAFKYYARSQLQPMSLDGKLQEVARALAGNLPNALSGIGLFVPVVSAYDLDEDTGRIFFYDASGARFETLEYGAAGSGSERIRGVFDYIVRTKGPFSERHLDEVLRDALYLLDIAADLDAMTGGFDKILPTAKYVNAEGVFDVSEEQLKSVIAEIRV